jgi:hypothetical protein
MTNIPSASDPDRIPYVPAWSDTTPPQGTPSYAPAPPQGDRRAPKERSVLLSPLVLGLAVLLLAVIGGGTYMYVNGGEKVAFREGDCLDDLAGGTPHITECGTPEASYQVVTIFEDTIDIGACSSVTGANIPVVIESKDVICVLPLKG